MGNPIYKASYSQQKSVLGNNLYGGQQFNPNSLGKNSLANIMMDNASGGSGMFNPKNPNGFPEYDNSMFGGGNKESYNKMVLGDGKTAEDIKGAQLSSMQDYQMGGQQMENPGMASFESMFGKRDPIGDGTEFDFLKGMGDPVDDGTNPPIGDGTEFNFLDDKNMQLPKENVADPKMPPTPGEAPKPSMLGMLPGVGNAISLIDGLANGPEKTKLDRVAFDRVDYNPVMAANNAAINRGTNTSNTNVKQNARTFGQLSGAQGANNLRGAQAQGESNAKLGALERNTNSQIGNRENTLNSQIGNQETVMNDQNKAAHRNQIIGDVMGIGTSIAGYGMDKAKMAADFAGNSNFMESMKYLSPMFAGLFDGKNLKMKTKYEDNKGEPMYDPYTGEKLN